MKLEECSALKIGDKVFVNGICNNKLPVEIVTFGYKAINYRYIGSTSEDLYKAYYYEIERLMTEEEVKAELDEIKRCKNIKVSKCPDCKKPIDKCKCVEQPISFHIEP